MSMIEDIKADQLKARKNKNVICANLLTTLLGEASAIGKSDGNRETTDLEVIQTIKKFVKNSRDFLKMVDTHSSQALVLITEIAILEEYLPIQLTAACLREIVMAVIEEDIEMSNKSPKNVGALMKYLAINFPGQYDGQVASDVVKELMSKNHVG